jgi:molybdopterin biosynthesis enzyme
LKLVETKNAVGHVLCHDITQIIRGQTKDARFRKGHVVTEEDIPVLLSLGKDNLYVWEKQPGMLHENEAAEILWNMLKSEHISPSPVKEGKINAFAEIDGLLKTERERIQAVNALGEMVIAVRHGNTAVKKGDKLGGTRIIPLVIEKAKMDRAVLAAGPDPLLKILPFVVRDAGVVTTGNEVFYGRIADAFTPVVEEKLAGFGARMAWHEVLNDDADKISAAIRAMVRKGAKLVICTGGMSVDPDDRTPLAIRNSGAKLVSYGAPVLPGSMFLLSYLDGVPVLGLPGCVMYARRTVFDLVLPRVMAGDPITAPELAALGEGGLCLDCPVCTFPNCGFGKGW